MTKARNSNSALVTLAAIVVAVAALYFAKEILLPLALAILLSFLLTPPTDRLERLGLGRIPSVFLVVSVTFFILGVLGWVVTSQLVQLSAELPNHKERLVEKIRAIKPESATMNKVAQTLEEVQKAATDAEPPPDSEQGGWSDWWRQLTGLELNAPTGRQPVEVRVVGTPASPLSQVREWLGPLVAPLTTAGIVVVLVIFMLIKREEQRNRLIQLFGGAHLHATTEAIADVTERVSKYLRMQFLINAGYGLLVGVGLSLMGLPNGVMWGVLAFSLRFLPYIGPWLAAIMPLIVSIAMSDGWRQPAMVVALFSVLELLVNMVAEPLLYGRSTGVSGVGVIVAALFWTWIWGPIGLVLAMPLTVCLVVLARYVPGLRFLDVLMGDQTALAVEERVYQRLLVGDVDEAKELCLERLNSGSLAQVYDDVLIPTLRLAEQDRHAARLSDEQEDLLQDSARDLVEELGAAARTRAREETVATDQPTNAAPAAHVLCIPLRDEADVTSAIMLKQVLELNNVSVENAAVAALTGELVESVEAQQADVVVISVLPPLPPRNCRLLTRRLRDRYPTLPIYVGFWNGSGGGKELQERLAAAADAEIAATLGEAAERVKAVASRTPAAGPAKPAVDVAATS